MLPSIRYLFLFIAMYACCSYSRQTFSQNNNCNGKTPYGRIETVMLPEQHIILNAKLDSGATMASLSAQNIAIIPTNHGAVVQFELTSDINGKQIIITKPLKRYVRILRRIDEKQNQSSNGYQAEYAERPVIDLPICIGHTNLNIEVNLTDRDIFKFPMLIGANALKKLNALIDVSQEHLTTPNCPPL